MTAVLMEHQTLPYGQGIMRRVALPPDASVLTGDLLEAHAEYQAAETALAAARAELPALHRALQAAPVRDAEQAATARAAGEPDPGDPHLDAARAAVDAQERELRVLDASAEQAATRYIDLLRDSAPLAAEQTDADARQSGLVLRDLLDEVETALRTHVGQRATADWLQAVVTGQRLPKAGNPDLYVNGLLRDLRRMVARSLNDAG